MVQIDEKDIEILRLLSEDARIPWRRLARMLNVSEATVYLRVKKLISEGVIKGFKVVIDPEKMGLHTSAYILLSVEAPRLREARETLKKSQHVYEAYEISGDYQFIVKTYAPDQDGLVNVIDEISSIPGVRDLKVLMVLKKIKDDESLIEALARWMKR